ncbi:hypothetical protein PQG02_15710 [Nostoc sp. UHCC 0926]|uniref:hypothetical protein n=1 Tax=unclassified Nostoc TaxID=2593658 RepID=UPI00235EE809|nr:hypothetical protein [Nostoc sp. UHCC 0926]WDD30235.1 hypothetical protein PQG02_15710 [Nostoc sp. UHCC 0926]
MPNGGLPPQDLRQQPNEEHFQALAGNEILKEFYLKLTRMSNALYPYSTGLFTIKE